MVANDDGSKSGVFFVVKMFFCALEVEFEGEDQCAWGEEAGTQLEPCVRSPSLSHVSSYGADFREQWSLLVVETFSSFTWPNPLTLS